MTRNKLKAVISAVTMSVLLLPTAAFAGELPAELGTTPAQNQQDTGGDEEAAYITSTDKNEVNNVQINYHVIVPEGFTLGAFVDIENADSGETYHIISTAPNQYYGRMFVPEGSYHIANYGIVDDLTDKYPLEKPEDFTVEKNESHTIETTLINYDEILTEANRRLGKAPAEDTKFLFEPFYT